MKLTAKTRINELLDKYPFMLDFLAGYTSRFSILKNRAFRATMGRVATIKKASIMGEVPFNSFIKDIKAEIEKRTGETVEIELFDEREHEERIAKLKEIIKDLHANNNVEEAKSRFNELIKEVDPTEITQMEEMLIKEGMPVTHIHSLCDTHLAVMREGLEDDPLPPLEPGHPIHTYIAENEALTKAAEAFDKAVKQIQNGGEEFGEAASALENLAEVDTHYVRKENQLFPYLEKRNITGPPKVMWSVHDDIRAMIKEARKAIADKDGKKLADTSPKLTRAVVEMVFKENKILFPMALGVLPEAEWIEIRKGDEEVGYILGVTPGAEWHNDIFADYRPKREEYRGGALPLETGTLTPEQINLILTTLPVDISFVDENDEVQYYTESKHRIFPRSPGVIGRDVKNCHPPKSVHIVERILEEFKSGGKDVAEFWIELQGKFLHIRYFAVRDKSGKYVGTLEMMQDVTEIRKLEGQRRLLNWEEK